MRKFFKKQMLENRIEFEIFPLAFDKNKFDFKKFYVNIMQYDLGEFNENYLEPAEKLEELNVRLRKKEYKKRSVGRIDFCLDGKNKIGVKIFSLLKKFRKPTAKILEATSKTQLKRIRNYTCKGTGEILEKDFLGRFYAIGDEKVVFNTNELEVMRNIVGHEFVLVGFKPTSALKIYHNILPSQFLVADDERVSNSSKVFDALIQEMIKNKNILQNKTKTKCF